jgi:hypothetical protein
MSAICPICGEGCGQPIEGAKVYHWECLAAEMARIHKIPDERVVMKEKVATEKQAALFCRLDKPDFEGLTADEAWQACEDWEDWMYSNAESFSEDKWDEMIGIANANYDRYYEEYES